METILTQKFLNKYRNKQPNWGFSGLGYIVFKRTYSRVMENGLNEEWVDTIERCINGAQKIGADYTREEAERLFDYMFNLKCLFAGRMLWQLGTNGVERYRGNAMLNCWFVQINEYEAFCFLFENLMLGGGVGFSVRREDIHELPKVKEGVLIEHKATKDADFIVPDSREGWVMLLRNVLKAFYIKGKSFTYSTILVRGKGELIKGFGGVASGATILIDGIQKIVKIFQSREGKKLRSIDVLDICNIIGGIVVSGNVRRSAQIAIGDPDDYLFVRAKRWDLGNIPNYRAMSNNTIYADNYTHISNDIWKGFEGNGEPYGFFNLPLAQKYGRLKDDKIKDKCIGLNPCGEINLESYECCNLSELFLNNIESKEELIDCAKLLYKTQKAVNCITFLHDKTNEVVAKNMRIGISVSGICQSEEKLEWLDRCYKELRKLDKEWSKLKNINESIKLTTVKPSGSISLLAGSSPGVHAPFSKYYIRRVRMMSDDPLVEVCKNLGYRVEFALNFDETINHNTVIVEFPCYVGEQVVTAKEMTAVQQLELLKKLQTIWADNSVSCTVYYKLNELESIKNWLAENYENNIKSVSFLLHSEHGFKQAPYEEIDKDTYEVLTSVLKPISSLQISGGDMDIKECTGNSCPIK
jgi:ribonucleotide reductase alpha subunit